MAPTPNLLQTSTVPGGPGGGTEPSFLGKLGDVAGDVGNFAENHDKTSAAALQTLGSLATQGQQNKRLAAETQLEQIQAQQAQYALERQQAQDAAMNPLRTAIYGRLGQTIMGAPQPTPTGP